MKLRGKAKARARRTARERKCGGVVSLQFTQAMYAPLPQDADAQFTAVWEAVHPILMAKGNPYAAPEPGDGGEEGEA